MSLRVSLRVSALLLAGFAAGPIVSDERGGATRDVLVLLHDGPMFAGELAMTRPLDKLMEIPRLSAVTERPSHCCL
jgi:hypothetical protein